MSARAEANRTAPVPRSRASGSAAGTVTVVGVATCAWVGALLAIPLPRWFPAGLGVAVLMAWRVGRNLPPAAVAGRSGVRGRRVLLVAGLGLAVGSLASGLAADSWAGLDRPVPPRLDARVELVGDPRPTRFGVRAEVRGGGRLWDVTATGEAAGTIGRLRAGESVVIAAAVRAREPDDRWRASRHVAGTAVVATAGSAEGAWGPWGVANAVHRALRESTLHLSPDVRGVTLGIALGDRGAIDDLLAEDLRAAGLSHLTAVSGQHVALLVGMATPLLGRLSARSSVLATLVLLAGFVILTRGEPSVLRAAAMAAVVALVRARGRRAVALRVLAVVVTALVVVDPMLVWSVGFQLSVAATVGIAVGASRLSAAIPGPRPLAAVLGVSLAAQLAVTPFVILHFGVMPLVGILANLAVVPTIGPLMMWSLGAGVVGGIVPALAGVLHLPTALLAGWVVRVAEWSSGLGVPGLRLPPPGVTVAVVGVLAAMVLAGWRLRRWGASPRRLTFGAVVVALLVVIGVAGAGSGEVPAGRHELAAGAEALAGGGRVVLILDGRAAPGFVVGALRRLGVTTVDVVVVRSSVPSTVAVVEALGQRVEVLEVAAAVGAPLERAVEIDRRSVVAVGDYEVVVVPGSTGRLDVTVGGPV